MAFYHACIAYNYGINKYADYNLPLNESSGDEQYNDDGYAKGFTGESQNPGYQKYEGDNGPANNYNYDYADNAPNEAGYPEEPEPPAQDIYSAGYEGVGQPANYPADSNDYDPYAGIDIDLEKVAKAGQKQKQREKEEEERAKKAAEEKPSDSESAGGKSKDGSRDRSGDKLPIELEKELAGESESDIDKARVEDDSDKSPAADKSDVTGSHEKVMNFQELKNMYAARDAENKDTVGKQEDALALAGNKSSEEDDIEPAKPAKSPIDPSTQRQEDKAYDSSSYAFTNSQAEENSSGPQTAHDIAKTAKQLKDKADLMESKSKGQPSEDQYEQPAVPKLAVPEAKPEEKKRAKVPTDNVSAGDTCSYEDDFEQPSIPGTSRDKDQPAATRAQKVEERPSEENSSSDRDAKPMTKKAEADEAANAAKAPAEVKQTVTPVAEKQPTNPAQAQLVLPATITKAETPRKDQVAPIAGIREEPKLVMEVIKKIRVDDKGIQTELGPVQFADKSTRECLLEATVMEEKKRSKQLQTGIEEKETEIAKLRESGKKMELDCLAAQKQADNAGETVKRLMSENKDIAHNSNMLKIEKEDLIRKTEELSQRLQDNEKDKTLIREECEKKVRIAEQRAEQKSQKLETRALDDLQRNAELDKSILKKQIEDRDEELSYYKEKCNKLEAENSSFRLTNKARVDADTKIRELQQENYVLQVKLTEAQAGKKEPVVGETKSDDTLRKEIETQEMLIKGYQKENENMTDEIRQLKFKIKEMEGLMYKENVRMREEQNKIVRENDKVMVVGDSTDVGIDVWNRLGKSNMMAAGELKSLKLQMDMLQMDKKRLEDQVKKTQEQSKSEVAMLLQQKQELEAKFGVSYEDMQRDKKDKARLETELEESRKKHTSEVDELRGRIKWLVDNQDKNMVQGRARHELVEKNVQLLHEKDQEISQLKQQLQEPRRSETKRPQTSKITSKTSTAKGKTVRFADNSGGEEGLKKRVQELEKRLKDTEASYESKLRTLQQQHEKVKTQYEAGGVRGSKAEARPKMDAELYEGRIKALEQEKEDVKQFYLGKIREYEQQENSGAATMTRVSRSDPNMESFAKPLKRLLISPEGSMIAKIYAETEKLKAAIQQHKQEQITQHMDEITHAFEKSATASQEVTDKQANMITRLIDRVMELGGAVTPTVRSEAEATKMVEDIQSIMLGEADKFANAPRERAANRYGSGEETSAQQQTKEPVIDFADSNFEVETQEDNVGKKTAEELRKWILAPGCKLTLDFVQKYYDTTHSGRVAAQEMVAAFTAAECETGTEKLQLFVRRAGIEADGKVDYVILLDNLKNKDSAWWAECITKNGNIEPDKGVPTKVPTMLRQFVQTSLVAKLKCLFRTELAEKLVKSSAFQGAKMELSKSELRKLFVDMRLPINREDTAVLFHVLSDRKGRSVPKQALEEFLLYPDKRTPSVREAWNDTVAQNSAAPGLENCYRKVAGQITRQKIDLEAEFRLLDPDQSGMITFDTLARVCSEAGLALATTELRAIFDSLQYGKDASTIDYNDFVQNVLLNSRAEAGEEGGAELKSRLDQSERENAGLRQVLAKTVSGGKWEDKARTLHVKCKELSGMCDTLGREKRDLEYKIQTITKDPKQRQILELQKKIEALESVVKERDTYIRKTIGEAENVELNAERKTAELEKGQLLQLIVSKNKEIMMFKSELDSVLEAMEKLKRKRRSAATVAASTTNI